MHQWWFATVHHDVGENRLAQRLGDWFIRAQIALMVELADTLL